MSKKVIIIDYQLGNLFSVNQALIKIGLHPVISSNPKDILNADAIILPGVGAFNDAVSNLKKLGLFEPIKLFVKSGKPFMGICLGLQLLFSHSEEFGESEGLDLVKGNVKKFKPNHKFKVPQIAWNTVKKGRNSSWENTPLNDINENTDFYFVHSFYVEPLDDSWALTLTTYGDTEYVSSIFQNNIFACQFHPEKSGEIGLRLYKNWAIQNKLL